MSDIDTVVVDSLKVLDPDGRLEKRPKCCVAASRRSCQEADIATMQQQIYLNTSTVANGSADHGRKRFNVNFVFCPGWTSTRR